MSKVRIYELAKEAGLKSKELADKLIELGYPVTSHSSTVDSDMAADIRRKVFGKASVEVMGKRIKVKRAPVVAQPTTVVRRRSKAVKEEIARIAEEAKAEEEAEIEAAAEEETVAAGASPEEEAAVGPETVEETEPEEEAEALPEEEAEAGAAKEEAEPESVGKKPVPVEAKAPRRLAKVVGKVEIRLPVEKKKRVPRRPARPTGPKPAIGAPPPGPNDGRGAVKGKKKGKRVVAIQADSDESRARRTGKVARKGRQRVDFLHGDDVEFMRARKGRKRKGKDGKKEKFALAPAAETKAIKKRIKVFETISVGDLAKRMGIKANEVIAKLMGLGVMATLNQSLDVDTATLVAADFGYDVEQGMTEELEVINLQEQELGGEEVARPPVVTVMGHVDHGKTSILDAIRKTDVAEGEAGGITQHIGAYHVLAPSGDVVFVDTPGHAAFTEMRSRGAKVTDIVVLVVAADDGVMDQTREAIAHARAAEVPIVVAINKIDKDNADTERVKRELSEFGLIPEDWGGDTIYCETSAKRHIGIEELLESIHLQAEILELKADTNRKARGTVIEAQLHKGRGPLATVLVQGGTLHIGDYFVAGRYSGKVRSLTNDRGIQVKEAGPSMPVEVQGLSGVPRPVTSSSWSPTRRWPRVSASPGGSRPVNPSWRRCPRFRWTICSRRWRNRN